MIVLSGLDLLFVALFLLGLMDACLTEGVFMCFTLLLVGAVGLSGVLFLGVNVTVKGVCSYGFTPYCYPVGLILMITLVGYLMASCLGCCGNSSHSEPVCRSSVVIMTMPPKPKAKRRGGRRGRNAKLRRRQKKQR